jgi:hypothetical protein
MMHTTALLLLLIGAPAAVHAGRQLPLPIEQLLQQQLQQQLQQELQQPTMQLQQQQQQIPQDHQFSMLQNASPQVLVTEPPLQEQEQAQESALHASPSAAALQQAQGQEEPHQLAVPTQTSDDMGVAPWDVPRPEVITYDPRNKTVYVNSTVDIPLTDSPVFPFVAAIADYPAKDENPLSWNFKAVSNASVVHGTTFPVSGAYLQSYANSKLAPAIALSSSNQQAPGPVIALARTQARARPGDQYGVSMTKSEYNLASTAPFVPIGTLKAPVVAVLSQDTYAGQGQAINLAKVVAEGNNLVFADSRGVSQANRWYMAPGHAVMGQAFILRGGQTGVIARNRANADLGTATSGVLSVLSSRGAIPYGYLRGKLDRKSYFLVESSLARADNRAFTDAGAANAGNVQLVRAAGGRGTIVGLSQARTAEGNAVAGAVNVGLAEDGDVYIGDYWDEISNPGNAVVATNYGRGDAQSGQLNIAISPNKNVRIGGVVAATAVQGSAVAGSLDIGNGYGEVDVDQDTTAVTSEYAAVAGTVGVAIAQERGAVVDNTIAKTDIGPALAYTVSTAVVAEQNSAISSSTSSTADGPATSLSASQALGGVQADSQGSALAKTSTGNVLSFGSSVSGASMNARAVSTATAATSEGASTAYSWSGAASAETEASSAASGVTSTGNTVAVAEGYSLGVLQGKATTASTAGTRAGSVGSVAFGVATGLVQAQGTSASSAQTGDGNVAALAGSIVAAGVNAVSQATASGASMTGDVAANALSLGMGGLHGEALSQAIATSGCLDCASDAVSNAVATGLIADATASASAASPVNPGNALANAVALGLISRTSNGGSARIAVGPGQALAGGFAVSLPRAQALAALAAAAGAQGDTGAAAGRAGASAAQQAQSRPPAL